MGTKGSSSAHTIPSCSGDYATGKACIRILHQEPVSGEEGLMMGYNTELGGLSFGSASPCVLGKLLNLSQYSEALGLA